MRYPEFLDEKSFLSLHDGLSESDLLKTYSHNLNLLHKLTTKHFENFNLLINEYLEVGLSIFDLDVGIVSSIEGNDYFICDALSPDNSLGKGDVFEVEGTYCNEVVKTGEVVGFPHVGSLNEIKDHPVYQNMKLESYISAPIYLNDEIFGTLNFSSKRIREHGFSIYERELIALMANSIATFLQLREGREKLEIANKRIRKLTSYVAHDLRSPLGNIKSLAAMIPELDKEEASEMLKSIEGLADRSLEIVHTILEATIVGDGTLKLDNHHAQ